jgi:hypothetical protein
LALAEDPEIMLVPRASNAPDKNPVRQVDVVRMLEAFENAPRKTFDAMARAIGFKGSYNQFKRFMIQRGWLVHNILVPYPTTGMETQRPLSTQVLKEIQELALEGFSIAQTYLEMRDRHKLQPWVSSEGKFRSALRASGFDFKLTISPTKLPDLSHLPTVKNQHQKHEKRSKGEARREGRYKMKTGMTRLW